MQRGGQAAGNTKEPFIFYGAVALIYLGFTSLSELAFRWLEQRYSIGTREGQL
jgi:arginine/ornithine transport system permease protein